MNTPPLHRILQPENWKPAKGYANGIAAPHGRTIYLGGQIGWNGDQQFETDDFVAQTKQALENIVAILAEAGGAPEHIVRLTWFVTDKADYVNRVAELGAAFLCADLELALQPREDHAAYIGHWLTVLQNDNRAIFRAAAHAQRAADHLHGLQPSLKEEAA